jgi:hypothetical protein
MDSETSFAIAELSGLELRALKARYRELYGESSASANKQFLIRRIAWRLQAAAEGDLSERARRRALELANDADLRLRPARVPRSGVSQESGPDWRLPPPGTVLSREFRGETHLVTIGSQGFDYKGHRYRSLSAVAFAIAGTRWNGFSFFRLGRTGRHG